MERGGDESLMRDPQLTQLLRIGETSSSAPSARQGVHFGEEGALPHHENPTLEPWQSAECCAKQVSGHMSGPKDVGFGDFSEPLVIALNGPYLYPCAFVRVNF
jgi:hypothetical protein